MGTFRSFEEIDAWREARALVREIHEVVASGPDFRRNRNMTDQIQRAAISIMSNIAEGFERDGRREFMRFLRIAKGSAGEVRSHLYVSKDLDLMSRASFESLFDRLRRVSRMTAGLLRYLDTKS